MIKQVKRHDINGCNLRRRLLLSSQMWCIETQDRSWPFKWGAAASSGDLVRALLFVSDPLIPGWKVSCRVSSLRRDVVGDGEIPVIRSTLISRALRINIWGVRYSFWMFGKWNEVYVIMEINDVIVHHKTLAVDAALYANKLIYRI